MALPRDPRLSPRRPSISQAPAHHPWIQLGRNSDDSHGARTGPERPLESLLLRSTGVAVPLAATFLLCSARDSRPSDNTQIASGTGASSTWIGPPFRVLCKTLSAQCLQLGGEAKHLRSAWNQRVPIDL